MLESNLRESVKYLAHLIGERSFRNLPALEKSASFIEEKFRASGLSFNRQPFEFSGNTYFNIIAEVHGKDPRALPFILGAHYDTVEGSPGADDNASGVAALLELARLLVHSPPERNIILAAFTLEEPPAFGESRMGSLVYAQSLRKGGVDIYGMASLEMLGFYLDEKNSQFYPLPAFRFMYPDKGNFIAFVGDAASKKLTNRFKETFKGHSDFPMKSLSASPLIPGISFSDHYSFWKSGYKAFMITDTAFYRNPYYHAKGDTWDTLDYARMARLVQGLYETVKRL
jgi:Zn-dependent M28 family amino/carboxypeptidase